MKGGDNQEKLVYQIIKDAGNKGLYIGANITKTFVDTMYMYVRVNLNKSFSVTSKNYLL